MTILKLLSDAGYACADFHDNAVRNVHAGRVQCDEIWSFLHAKDKTLARGRVKAAPPEAGSLWTWTGIDQDSKLMISWSVSQDRGAVAALEFMKDLRSRVTGRIQLYTDGLNSYRPAVARAFGQDVDFGQVVKHYDRAGRYTGSIKTVVSGHPRGISTNHVERHNLTMRTNMRRYTRRGTTGSKKIDNHLHQLALYFVWYNFCRPHMSLGDFTTPAMAAGLAEEQHSLQWLVNLTDGAVDYPVWEPAPPEPAYGSRDVDPDLEKRLQHYEGQPRRII